MKITMAIASLALITIAGVIPATAQDHNYIPLESGNDHRYENMDNPALTVRIYYEEGPAGASISTQEFMVNGEIVAALQAHFIGNDEGDVIWIGPVIGGELVPFTSTYLTIDAPLFAGKIWSFEASHPIFGLVEVTAEVVAEEWLTVPGIGDLYCYKVHRDEVYENQGSLSTDHWYADGFGDVKFTEPRSGTAEPYLVTAADVVSVEAKTWSGVKSLYR
jgi:hypothetical protein